jgi:hypothetical protein
MRWVSSSSGFEGLLDVYSDGFFVFGVLLVGNRIL